MEPCAGIVRAAFFLCTLFHVDCNFMFYQLLFNAYGLLVMQLCWFLCLLIAPCAVFAAVAQSFLVY